MSFGEYLFDFSHRVERKVVSACASYLAYDLRASTRIKRVAGLVRIGSDYGGWIVPTSLLSRDSVCYCVGVGEDISFDLGLIRQVGCDVYAFDPTPRARAFVERTAADEPLFHFFPLGVWRSDETKRFYAPTNPNHVSHSILNLQKTSTYFDADCRRLSTLMRQNGHERIDLLKLDIEGAEYGVIDSIVADNLNIRIICVEYNEVHCRIDNDYSRRIRESIRSLLGRGYEMVAVDKSDYTFVKHD